MTPFLFCVDHTNILFLLLFTTTMYVRGSCYAPPCTASRSAYSITSISTNRPGVSVALSIAMSEHRVYCEYECIHFPPRPTILEFRKVEKRREKFGERQMRKKQYKHKTDEIRTDYAWLASFIVAYERCNSIPPYRQVQDMRQVK